MASWQSADLVSDAVRKSLGDDALILNAAMVVNYIGPDGEPEIACFYDAEQHFFAREGMVRVLLRDVTAVALERERRHACRIVDEEDGDD